MTMDLKNFFDLNKVDFTDSELEVPYEGSAMNKPIVPQFVADWYECHKDNLSKDIIEFIIDYTDEYDDQITESLACWFCNNEDDVIETLVKMKLLGYQVEKVKRN